MASGDTLAVFTAHNNQPPASNYATLDTRNNHLVLDFDAATDESAIFGGVLPRHYSGGGLTVRVGWMASTATSGNAVMTGAWERGIDESGDMDSDSFATAISVTAAAPSTSGFIQYTDIAFTSGTQMDSLAVGEGYRLQITRNASNGSDTMSGDLELWRVEVREI